MHTFTQVETRFARNKAQVAPIDDKKEDAEALDAAAATLAAADPKAPPANRPSIDTSNRPSIDDLNHLSPMHKVSVLRSGPLGEGDEGVQSSLFQIGLFPPDSPPTPGRSFGHRRM